MPWTASALLGTVVENQSFSYPIQYYTETTSGSTTDPITGVVTPGTTTQVYYNVNIVPAAVKPTITITNGNPATIVGYYQKMFNDTIQYRNHNNQIITLTGDATTGAWDKLTAAKADVFHLTSFKPDTVRDMSFSFTANAVDNLNNIIATTTYTIRVYDPSWDSGKAALHYALQETEK
jgi:hypothetical protein